MKIRPPAAGILILSAVLALHPARGAAAPAQHTFHGTIAAFTFGASTEFAVGQPVVVVYDIERSTPPVVVPNHATYFDAITSLEVTIGDHSARLAPGGTSRVDVYNDYFFQVSSYQYYYRDEYVLLVPQLQGEPIDPTGLRFLELRVGPAGDGPAVAALLRHVHSGLVRRLSQRTPPVHRHRSRCGGNANPLLGGRGPGAHNQLGSRQVALRSLAIRRYSASWSSPNVRLRREQTIRAVAMNFSTS